jgi:hypothetical protein
MVGACVSLAPRSRRHQASASPQERRREISGRSSSARGSIPCWRGALQEAVHRAIALHRRSCTWTEVHAGWVVTLRFPERRRFFGTTLEEALTWCLAWVMGEKVRLLHPRDRNREGTDERAWHRCGLGDG